MSQYNSLNVQLSNLQLIKSMLNTEIVLRLSSNMIGNSDDETNFPYELLLTNRKFPSFRKPFANISSTDIKLSKLSYLR